MGLSDNDFTGHIPQEIFTAPCSLRYFGAYGNQLSGPLPDGIGNCENLVNMWIRDNSLTCSIPSSFGNLKALESLDLGNNNLTGTIPTSIEDMASIESLDLDGNKLSRTVPEVQEGKLSTLVSLRLHWNDLTGAIPDSICNLGLDVLTADCGGELPEIVCDCCVVGARSGCYEDV